MRDDRLSSWTEVKLARSGGIADGLAAPRSSVGAGPDEDLPAEVLIRPRRGRRKIQVAGMRWSNAPEPHVKASPRVFDAINRQQHAEFPVAELKRPNRVDWVRYDEDTRANITLAVAAVLVAAWGVVAAAVDGAIWPKTVAATLAVIVAILGLRFKWRARG